MGDIIYKPLIEDMTFSHSRLKSYLACPYGWKLQYIDECAENSQFYSSYGNLMHDILAKYFKGEILRSEMPVEFLARFSTDVRGLRPSAGIVEKYIDAGLSYLKEFSELDLNIIAVEQEVSFNIGEIKMTGFIDLIGEKDGNLYCIDHKSHDLKPRSGRLKPTVKDIELDEYLQQLYLYSKAIKDIYGNFPKELWFNCYRTNTLIKEQFDLKKYEKTLQWVTETVEKIKNDTDFEANYDYFCCRWICGQQLNCEVFEEEVMGY